MEFVCDEMEDLERKVEKEGKLSSAEMQYLDLLAHTKKNLLKADEMSGDGEYSGRYDNRMYDDRYSRRDDYSRNRDGGMSYARGRGRNAKRDSMGRYSSASDMLVEELRDLMEDAPDERTKMEFKKFIQKMESM
jgi:hypothetical protein